MTWAEGFYSRTGYWWGQAESGVDHVDRWRASIALELAGPGASILELGCGYGSTANAMANLGLDVTAIDLSDCVVAVLTSSGPHSPRFVRGDFYDAELGEDFDLVCYWDGFGVGTDADQRRLLKRIRHDWLRPEGVAVVEVFSPSWWSAQAGLEETKEARPADGYPFSLGHRRGFDATTCRAFDTWWEVGTAELWTQSLRCYSAADLLLLLEGTSLRVASLRGADPTSVTGTGRLEEEPSYLALLERT